jgi:hypothetical protein
VIDRATMVDSTNSLMGTKIQPTKGIWSNGLNRANNDRIISRFEL